MSDARDALREQFNKWCDSQTGFLFSPGAKSSDFFYEIWLAGRDARAQAEGGTVPREPTVAMCVAARDHIVLEDEDDDESDELAACIWRAMWDAAPRASEGKEPTMEHWQACDIALGGDGGLPAAAPADPHASTAERYADRFAPMRAAAPDAELIAEIDDAMREQVSTTVRCLLRERLRERLAQPEVPTQWAYDQACKALHKREAEIESKDKALREIASIRPFGMISDAQIIASAALGDTQEPQS